MKKVLPIILVLIFCGMMGCLPRNEDNEDVINNVNIKPGSANVFRSITVDFKQINEIGYEFDINVLVNEGYNVDKIVISEITGDIIISENLGQATLTMCSSQYESGKMELTAFDKENAIVTIVHQFKETSTSSSNLYPELDKDSEGWSVFIPSNDSRIIYISESGNDDTGEFYSANANEVGSNPFEPTGAVKPFATYEAASKNAREGFSDWILFKRGEVFTAQINLKCGKNDNEFSLVGAYGSTGALPLIKPKDNETTVLRAFSRNGYIYEYAAISSIDFYSDLRDPNSSSYVGIDGNSGIGFIALGHGTEKGTIRQILIEGCKFRSFSGNTIQAYQDGEVKGISLRRNHFLDTYTAYTAGYNSDHTAHSQGLYTSNIVGILLEENVFDHNGWYSVAGGFPGEATMFNHNTYFTSVKNATFRKNIFLRPSSIHNKFTAEDGQASASNIIIENNLYVDGEIGISIGGNAIGAYRYKDITVKRNVFTELGRSRPTDRTLAWAIEIRDWDNGIATENLNIHNSNPEVTGAVGFFIDGTSRNATASSNIVYNIKGLGLMVNNRFQTGGGENKLLEISNNIFQEPNFSNLLMTFANYTGITCNSNTFFNTNNDQQISRTGTLGTGFQTYNMTEWQNYANTNSTFEEKRFLDSTKSIETYQSSIGESANIESFIDNCRNQDRYNWDVKYSADIVNNWLREGFF